MKEKKKKKKKKRERERERNMKEKNEKKRKKKSNSLFIPSSAFVLCEKVIYRSIFLRTNTQKRVSKAVPTHKVNNLFC